MKEIQLTKGHVALVSDKDYRRVSQHKWYVKIYKGGIKYAACYLPRVLGKSKSQKLHRFILGISDPKVQVDHKDGNGLNCLRRNLRTATCSQNQGNRKLNKNNKSGVKGTHWCRNLWRVQIQVKGKRLTLGFTLDLSKAEKMYNQAAKKYFGRFALNNAA